MSLSDEALYLPSPFDRDVVQNAFFEVLYEPHAHSLSSLFSQIHPETSVVKETNSVNKI